MLFSWENQGIYVLNAIDDLKRSFSKQEERGVEILESLARIDSKFDQYNGFNDKLTRLDEKHDRDMQVMGAALKVQSEENTTLKAKIEGLNSRFLLFLSGVGIVVTIAVNLLVDWLKGML